jgi:acyl carrier protein
MNKFIEKLEEMLEMSDGSINLKDNFREYDVWDSLALLSLMAMLEDEYSITIPRDEFQKINTIEELFNYVNINQNGKH